MTLEALRRDNKESILQAARKYGARNVRVFGSAARGEAGAGSDVDFLVELESGRTLMDLGGFLSALQELLDTEVDVATERMPRPNVRERALRDATPL
ncbi:MAG: nucleotidyltransferase family protein [Bryobacteraceae bacterium]